MQSSVPVRSRAPAGNTATGWLKVLALVFMFIDHAGKVLFNNMQEMRILGRIAFPLYVWCMIVGFYYTRSVWKYMLRILITGLISQPLYVVALNHEWTEPNIFLTLFLGLCALWGIREKKYGSQIWAPAIAIMLATILGANYGWQGVVLFILLYAVQETRAGIAAVMVAYFMFWGASYSLTKSLFGIRISLDELPAFISRPLSPFLRMEAYALLSLPLILIPFKHDLKMPRWLGYALYPAHLVLLIILKAVMGV
jgi:hypothetical protein